MKKLLLLAILPIICSCNGQEKKETAEENTIKTEKNKDPNALELENFDFATQLSKILPPSAIDEDDPGYYQLKTLTLKADTISTYNFDGTEKHVVRIEYLQYGFSPVDYLAKYGDFYFNGFSFSTTSDDKIMLMSAFVEDIDAEETQKFIKTLEAKYGKATKTKSDIMSISDDYTWTLNDRIIRYSVTPEDDENNIRIDADENEQLKQGEKQPHTSALLYIINKKYKKDLVEHPSISTNLTDLRDK